MAIKYGVQGSVLTWTVGTIGTVELDIMAVVGGEKIWNKTTDLGRAGWINGFKQKIADRAAIPHDEDTGLAATDSDKFDAMLETAQRLLDGGAWNVTRTGSGEPVGGVLYRAMARLYPNVFKTKADFAAYVTRIAGETNAKPADVKRSMRETPNIREMIRTIESEAPKPTLDLTNVLAQLDQPT